jgi:hypothetical protein
VPPPWAAAGYIVVVRQSLRLEEAPGPLPMSDPAAEANSNGTAVASPAKTSSVSAMPRFVLWAVIGGALGLAGSLFVLRWTNRDSTPDLTPELFYAAHERWKAAAPADYDIEVRVTGSQPAVYRVEVRGGQPRAAWRNGQPLLSRRTFGTWSAPGMFGTISRDIEAVEKHTAGKADRFTPRLILRAEFDLTYSYPKRYRRIEQWSNVEVAWEVVEFRIKE